ncbi:site-specific DNA-methyltransferase [Brevundimonas lenta]|uniref:site-specific DNA-methyltransferase (adenine-specific) n=1 Tax=Brevundimonas lenta TaxID=424796 RepID=A0A7W6JAX7_9CAUL|nr:DNA methyltransferase [Brevundimonas lenta]MBB4081749.1 adenine-specific DNA-methyltransferase [Brevundimonas lenta]
MSRLTDLIARAKAKDAQLGSDLEKEFRALSSRRAFGLNFERHRPEAVELPGRPVRKGDKVRILAPRGETKRGDQRLWIVTGLTRRDGGTIARLEGHEEVEAGHALETAEAAVDDLVVIAAFGDRIYPGLVSTGKIERGDRAPFHTVINAENYHALKALTYTHRGRIDAIYIDPPYNSGASDWKYNNDYVGEDDQYRHSKWLAFIERRLLVARELLNLKNSVLIVAIDDKEYSRLALLLEQVFPDARMEMVTTVINPRGKYRKGNFGRCEDYLFFLMFGEAVVLGEADQDYGEGASVPWRTLRRSDLSSARGTKKGGTSQFYPIYVSEAGTILQIGPPLPHSVDRNSAPQIEGATAVFPIRDDGTEMNWGLTGGSLEDLRRKGYVRVGRHTPDKPQAFEISYLTSGRIADIETKKATVVGRNPDNSVIAIYDESKIKMPITSWHKPSHNAEIHGTDLVKSLVGERGFPFPKSLYAVEDSLRLFLANKPDAVVLDFFAGSGTTAHAVMRMNHLDGGRRQAILTTNNEVGADEQIKLRKKGLRPGDADWECWGICDYITKPRVASALTGLTPDGRPVEGEYKFVDEFPIADGFAANAEFFTLTYETPRAVDHNKAFARIAPLLWMRAGSTGRRIEALPERGWELAEAYGLLTDMDHAEVFGEACAAAEGLRMAFIVTNDDRRFEAVCRLMPEGVEPVRLYESYLTNFAFESGGGEE